METKIITTPEQDLTIVIIAIPVYLITTLLIMVTILSSL
jgi:hypothetical protein